MNDAQIVKLIQNLISTTVEKIIDKTLRGKYLICRKAVIVKNYNTTTNRATVFIPTDPNIESNYAYYNKTGRKLVEGQKVYLVYQLNSISQGWLENMYPSEIEELNTNQLIVGGKNLNTSQSQTMDDMVASFGFQYGAKTGSPTTGPFISFNGLTDNYRLQLTCDYQYGQDYYFRVKNGDDNIWKPWIKLPVITDNSYLKMSAKNGFLGIDECTGNYLRTPISGLLPNKPGVSSNIGSPSWTFDNAFFMKFYAYDWFRSYGNTGWYNETYGGGIYMEDANIIRIYGNKVFYSSNLINIYKCYIRETNMGSSGYAISGGYENNSESITCLKIVDNQPYPWMIVYTPWNGRAKSWGVDINFSDKRMKKNIKELYSVQNKSRTTTINYFNALDIIKKIKYYSYDIINSLENINSHVSVGYVADELELLYPEGVYEVGEDKIKHISNSRMFPLISLAIKQQSLIIDEQSKKIEDLEKRITNLEKILINN